METLPPAGAQEKDPALCSQTSLCPPPPHSEAQELRLAGSPGVGRSWWGGGCPLAPSNRRACTHPPRPRRATFPVHAHLEALEQAAVLAPVALLAGHDAVLVAAASVDALVADAALEEALAALAGDDPVVQPRRAVAADQAGALIHTLICRRQAGVCVTGWGGAAGDPQPWKWGGHRVAGSRREPVTGVGEGAGGGATQTHGRHSSRSSSNAVRSGRGRDSPQQAEDLADLPREPDGSLRGEGAVTPPC